MTGLKLHLFDMSFESRFLRSKKQDHCVKEKICLYVIMSKKNTLQIFNLSVERTQHAVSLLLIVDHVDARAVRPYYLLIISICIFLR